MIVFLGHIIARVKACVPVISVALVMCASASDAWAMKVDPVWGAQHAAAQATAAHPLRSMTRSHHPLVLNPPADPAALVEAPENSKEYTEIRGLRITPTSVSWKVNGLKPQLVKLLVRVQLHFGQPLDIISGCRDKKHNRRVGGAKRSQHLHCKAADFKVPGVSKNKLAAYLKQMPGRGGVGLYCSSDYVHLDVGPMRQWRWKCGKRKKYKKRRARRKVAKPSKNISKRRALRKVSKKRSNKRVRVTKIDR